MLIDNALKDLEKRKQRFLSWRDAEKIALQAKEKFSKNGLKISIGLDWISANDGIYIHIYSVKDLSDLKPVFRFLAKSGYQRTSKPLIMGELNLVIWQYNKIKLHAYFTSQEPDACKFKQIGTKEVPIYEIDCPGLE